MNLKKILPVFSYVFHPIFIPAYAALYYFFFNNSNFETKEKYFVILQIAIITIALPIGLFFILRAVGKVDSIMISDLKQRKIPLIILCFLIILLVRKTAPLKVYPELHFFFLGGLISTLQALLFLFFKTKASLHMMTISALMVFVVGLNIHHQIWNINWILFLILINGFVGYSRLKMKAHTTKELGIGFLLGVIPQLLLLHFWL